MSFQFGSVILYGDPYFVGTNSSITLAKTNDNQTFTAISIFVPADVYLTVYAIYILQIILDSNRLIPAAF